ncbi:MAG: ABC transporter substrate-binding protein [Actinobacteria bacterium]|nr:ABC transporter substrate-binding protein [Actinomycetota bacterium]
MVMTISCRQLIARGVSIAVFFAACGKTEDDNSVTEQRRADGFPRTIETGLGSVTVPARPSRVVTLGYEVAVMLDLGIVPVGMAREPFDPTGVAPYKREPIVGHVVDLISSDTGLTYEQIAGLRPDLILAGTYFDIDNEFDRLSAIAPVSTAGEQATLIGEVLGKEEEEEAAAAVASAEDRITSIAANHAGWAGKTFSLSFNFDFGR